MLASDIFLLHIPCVRGETVFVWPAGAKNAIREPLSRGNCRPEFKCTRAMPSRAVDCRIKVLAGVVNTPFHLSLCTAVCAKASFLQGKGGCRGVDAARVVVARTVYRCPVQFVLNRGVRSSWVWPVVSLVVLFGAGRAHRLGQQVASEPMCWHPALGRFAAATKDFPAQL